MLCFHIPHQESENLEY